MAAAPVRRRAQGRGAGSGKEPPPSPLPWRLGGAALGGSNGGGASRSRPVSLRGRPRPFHFRRCLGVNIRVSAAPPRPFAASPPISARLAGYRQVWSAARKRGGAARAGRTIPRAPRRGRSRAAGGGTRRGSNHQPQRGVKPGGQLETEGGDKGWACGRARRRLGLRGAGPLSAPAARQSGAPLLRHLLNHQMGLRGEGKPAPAGRGHGERQPEQVTFW